MGNVVCVVKYFMCGGIKLYWHELEVDILLMNGEASSKLRRWPQVSISHLNTTICHQILCYIFTEMLFRNFLQILETDSNFKASQMKTQEPTSVQPTSPLPNSRSLRVCL